MRGGRLVMMTSMFLEVRICGLDAGPGMRVAEQSPDAMLLAKGAAARAGLVGAAAFCDLSPACSRRLRVAHQTQLIPSAARRAATGQGCIEDRLAALSRHLGESGPYPAQRGGGELAQLPGVGAKGRQRIPPVEH